MSRDALVVGINTYSYDRLRNLTAPAQDAEAIAKLLEDYGEFNVKRLPAVKDKQNNTIRVGQKTGVTLTQLEEAIVQLFKPEGKNISDTALLYFSGHGLRRSRGIQEGFLATSDVNPDLGYCGLPLQWLRKLLQESEVKQQIIWLDCCYSGELLNFDEANPGDRGKGRDRCFIAASREFETAFEALGTNHSVFTTALRQGLKPREHQQRVTNYTLSSAIQENLPNFPQRPIFDNSGGIIYLTRTQQAIPEVGEVSKNNVKDESEQQQLKSNSVMGQPTQSTSNSNVSYPTRQFQNLVQFWTMRTMQVRKFVLLTFGLLSITVIISYITSPKLIKEVNVPVGKFNYTGTTTWSSVRCDNNATGIDKEVSFRSKDSAFQPVYVLPQKSNPTITGVSSLEAIDSLINSEDVAFAVSSRPLDNTQIGAAQDKGLTLKEYPVALDITTIAVNSNLNLTKFGGLSLRNLKEIYTSDQSKYWGKITNSDISPDIPIVPFIHKAEKTKKYPFQTNVLKGQSFGSIVKTVENTTTGINSVKNNPGGIYLAPAALIYTYYHQKQPSVQPMPIGQQGKPVLPFKESFNPQDVCDPQKQENSPVQEVNPEYPKELQHEIVYVIVKRHNTNATEDQKKQEKAGHAYAKILKTVEGRSLLERMGFQPYHNSLIDRIAESWDD